MGNVPYWLNIGLYCTNMAVLLGIVYFEHSHTQ